MALAVRSLAISAGWPKGRAESVDARDVDNRCVHAYPPDNAAEVRDQERTIRSDRQVNGLDRGKACSAATDQEPRVAPLLLSPASGSPARGRLSVALRDERQRAEARTLFACASMR